MAAPSDSTPARLRRPLLLAAGWVCILLGAIGVFLPLLPTTPFLLLAAACFARSSPRYHRWLMSNKHFGPLLTQWRRSKEIPPGIKVKAMVITAMMFAISITVVDVLALRVLLICIAGCVLVFLGRIPTVAADVALRRGEEAH